MESGKSYKWKNYQPILHPTAEDFEERIIYLDGDYIAKSNEDIEAQNLISLLKLDDAIIKQNLAAAKQNLETIKTQLSFAKNILQRQQNLWNQNIGTEVQLITAKNNVATIETQLKSADENIKTIIAGIFSKFLYLLIFL